MAGQTENDPGPDAEDYAAETQAEPRSRGAAWRKVRIIGTGLAAVLAIMAMALFLLDTSPGRRFVADQIAGLEFENGMQIEVGRIGGSLYGQMVLYDLSIKDPTGEFLYVPEVDVDWRPFAFAGNHIDIRSATAKRMYFRRLPKLRETPPTDEPLLPDLDIDIAQLKIARIIVDKTVTGVQRLATIGGKVRIASGRAQISVDGRTLKRAGGEGGDSLSLLLDAVPHANRLAIDLGIKAPRDGVIAALAGLDAPLEVALNGKGDWDAWRGALNANYGKAQIAGLDLSARDGTWGLKGPLQLGLLFAGQPQHLLADEARVDLTAKLGARSAVVSGNIASDSFRMDANGGIDLSNNSFDRLKLGLVLLKPSALAENLRGSGVRAMLELDGAFAAPMVGYSVNADRLTMDDIGLVQLSASGKARIDAERILIPVSARVQRITGLDTVAGGRLANVSLSGDLAIEGGRVLSDNMKVRSDRIDATAILLANLETGLYSGAINGKIDNYRLESVGIFNIESDTRLNSKARGFALKGRVRARSTRLLNEQVQTYLGGNFVAASDVLYAGDGTVRFSNLQLNAPDLRITGGRGSYVPGGQIRIIADGRSDRYGKVRVRVAGTLEKPDAQIAIDRPDLGIGLANLNARITGARAGYRLDLKGDTDFGPLTADVTLGTGTRTRIDINSANLSGVGFAGSLEQTRAGPYAGTLRANGNGLGGIATLGAQGRYQSAKFNIRANNSRFRGPANLSIGSAIIDGHAVLYDQPEIAADVQLSDTRYGDFFLNAGRARIDYAKGRGTARALIEGTGGVPFKVALNASLEPKLWRVAVDGKAHAIAFKTRTPARIVAKGSSYELLPTTVAAGNGTVRLAGRYGKGMKLQSRMEDVDIALINAFLPGMGLGGKVSGSLDFTQSSAAAFPRADARISLSNFTRTNAGGVSQPVNVNIVGKLLANGGEARAVIRRRGSVIGRMAANLRPLGAGRGAWPERLLKAPLSGGIRYNGPASTLFSFAGQSGQSLDGPLGVAADFSCQLGNPCLNGVLQGDGLVYRNSEYGTRLSDLDFKGRFGGNRLQIETMSASAGKGSITAAGYVGLSSDAGFPIDISVTLDRARLARSDGLSASATGQLRLTKSAGQAALLSGELTLPETRYQIVRQGAAQVPQLSGVRFKPRRGPRRITGDEAADPISSLLDLVRLDIRLRAPEKLYVSGMGLESEWGADFTVSGTSAAQRLNGNVRLVRGTLGFAGKSFKLTEGAIDFTGGREINPRLRIVATEDVEDVAVSVNVGGRALDPQITFSSVPALPQDEIMARILFGSSVTNLSAIQAVQLASSLNSLRGSGGGLNPLGKLGSATGIDRLRILGADEASGRGTALAAGQYLTDDIYVELITDTRGFTATQLEVSITPWLSVLSQAGGSGTSNVTVQVKKTY